MSPADRLPSVQQAATVKAEFKYRQQIAGRISVCLMCMILAALSLAQENTAADNPRARVARISYLKGKVSFLPAGQDQWSEATRNFVVTTGDRLYADKEARAELEVGPYTVRLWEATDLTVTNLNDHIMQLGLEQGTIRVSVYR